MTEFPQSPLKPTAQVILSVREQATQLSVDVSRLNNEAGQLRNEVAQLRNEASQLRNEGSQLRNDISQLNEELAKVKADAAAQIALEVEKRDQRIKQLNTELERLIRIDADKRRPARPRVSPQALSRWRFSASLPSLPSGPKTESSPNPAFAALSR